MNLQIASAPITDDDTVVDYAHDSRIMNNNKVSLHRSTALRPPSLPAVEHAGHRRPAGGHYGLVYGLGQRPGRRTRSLST